MRTLSLSGRGWIVSVAWYKLLNLIDLREVGSVELVGSFWTGRHLGGFDWGGQWAERVERVGGRSRRGNERGHLIGITAETLVFYTMSTTL